MADNKIQLPSSMGGLIRYSDEASTKVHIKPGTVLFFIVIIILIEILLHTYGASLLS